MTAISEDEFCNSFYGAVQAEGSCGWYVRKSHKSLEKGLPYFAADTRILELGCNLGEHCAYVEHEYLTYVATDYREIDFEPLNSKIEFMVADAQNLPFPNDSFDRLIMTCVLHHLNFPEKALDEMRRVSRNGATISIIVPTDPGIMYRFAKKIGPYKKIVKKGRSLSPSTFTTNSTGTTSPESSHSSDSSFGMTKFQKNAGHFLGSSGTSIFFPYFR